MLFDATNLSKFELAFVGESFEDAKKKRDDSTHIPQLTAITGRRTNDITAEELDRALSSPNPVIRRYATQLKDNNKTFLLTVCKQDCRRTSADYDARGLGTHYSGSRSGGRSYFNRRSGNGKGPNFLCNNGDDNENHFCPTTSSNSYSIEDKKPDGIQYFLSDQFTIEIKTLHGSSPETSIYQHRSKMKRAPAIYNDEIRKATIQKFETFAQGTVNLENLDFRREHGYENVIKNKFQGNDPYTLAMRPFRRLSKECRFFLGKMEIAVDAFTKRGVFEEFLIHYKRGNISLNVPRDNGLLVWIPGGVSNMLPPSSYQILEDLDEKTNGKVKLISQKDVFAENYSGNFVFFQSPFEFRKHSNALFGSLEEEGILHRQARPSLSPKPNWMNITWHPSHTPEFYRDSDTWDIPRPDLISTTGQLHLMLTLTSGKTYYENKIIGIYVRLGSDILQKGFFPVDQFGRLFISLQFPKIGNYVIGIDEGVNHRFIQLAVTNLEQGSMISVMYSDANQQWLALPLHEQSVSVSPAKCSIQNTELKTELIQHHLGHTFREYDLSIADFDNYSLEHVLREITRITFHQHLPTWLRKRNKIFSLLLDNYSLIDEPDKRAIGEYLKEDIVAFEIGKRDDVEAPIHWVMKSPTTQSIHRITEYLILHDGRSNNQVSKIYSGLIIDDISGIRFVPLETVEEMELPIHSIRSDLEAMTHRSAEEWIESVWTAAQHTAEPLAQISANEYPIRWNGAMDFTREKIKQTIQHVAPKSRRYDYWDGFNTNEWVSKGSYSDMLTYKKDKKLYFLQLTISKEKRDQDYPWELNLGVLDFSDGLIESGIVLSTESVDIDRQRLTWLDSVGTSNGLESTKLLLPWFQYPRGSQAGDPPYILRETVRAFASLHKSLSDDRLGGKGLPGTFFRKNSTKINNLYAFHQNGMLGLYDVCVKVGILDQDVELEVLSREARIDLLKRMWWKYED